MTTFRTRHRLLAATAVAGALLAGCATDATDDAAPAAADEPTTDDAAGNDPATQGPADGDAGATVEITGVDYGFEGLPDVVTAGTTFTFTNTSEEEVHELVLVKRPEDETRPVDELLALPPDELYGALEMVGVAFAMPGEAGEVVEGELAVTEPGTYLMICNLPVGTSPEDLEGEMPADAVPHHHEGMVTEFTVA